MSDNKKATAAVSPEKPTHEPKQVKRPGRKKGSKLELSNLVDGGYAGRRYITRKDGGS